MGYPFFEKAKPIFLKGKSQETNIFAAFRTEINIEKNEDTTLYIHSLQLLQTHRKRKIRCVRARPYRQRIRPC